MKRCIKWLINWFIRWINGLEWQEKVGFCIGGVCGISIVIVLLISFNPHISVLSSWLLLSTICGVCVYATISLIVTMTIYFIAIIKDKLPRK